MKFKNAIAHVVEKFTFCDFLKDREIEDQTKLRHMDILKEINALGFLTDSSQSGHIEPYKNNQTKLYKERSFITGFMKKKKAEQFMLAMHTQTEKSVDYVPKLTTNWEYASASFEVPVTITEYPDGKVEVHTRLLTYFPREEWDHQRKILKINKNEPVIFIQVWDSRWGWDASEPMTGLFCEVKKILNQLK